MAGAGNVGSACATGKVQLFLCQVVRQPGGLSGGPGHVPAVDEGLGDAYVESYSPRDVANRRVDDAFEHTRLAEGVQQGGAGRAVGSNRIIAELVDGLHLPEVLARGRLLAAQDTGEHSIAEGE